MKGMIIIKVHLDSTTDIIIENRHFDILNNKKRGIEELKDYLLSVMSCVKKFESDEEWCKYMKEHSTKEQFKQIYNIVNQIEPLPEPAFLGRVYILSDD